MASLLDLLDEMVFVDVRDGAELANCSMRTILRRAEDSGLKVHVIGNKFFFMAKEFKRFMEEHPVGSHTHSPR